MVTLGIVLAFLSDTAFSYSGNWRAMLGGLALPAVLLIILVVFLTNSPRWLAEKGRHIEAEEVLRMLRDTSEKAREELNEIRESLKLKQGGWALFKINRNFRNEGISVRHNPEFTMMELYMAYADYKDLIELTESLFCTLAQDILGKTEVTYGDVTLDFGKPFEKLTMREAIKKYRPETDMADLDNFDSAKAIAESIGIHVEKSWGLGRIVTEIFEEVAEAHLIQPTFITEYPAEVSPLARRNDVNPEITDRFSELNDAEDQAQRFLDQVAAKDAGDDEAMFYDEDYATALEHGLPPTAGLGIGIDRMVMLFTNSHTIRDVILFPAMRPVK